MHFYLVRLLVSLFFVDPPVNQSNWSSPSIIYEIPDSVRYVKQYDAGLLDGRMDLLIEQYDTTGTTLDFSEVYFLKDIGSPNPEQILISNPSFRAEYPTMVYTDNDIHFYWGERRFDPEFKEWERPRAPMAKYATSVFSSSLSNPEPTVVYSSGLWVFGLSDLTLPVISVFEGHKIYATTGLDTTLIASNDPGTNMVGFLKYDTITDERYLSKPVQGHSPSVTANGVGNVWITYLGSDTLNYGRNNTYVIHSQDDGSTWSSPLMLSQSDDFQVEVSVKESGDESLHILHSTSTDELPVPNQLWHTTSSDRGVTWQDKTLIYDTATENLDETLYIIRHRSVTDSNGQLHLVILISSTGPSKFGLYTFWNPLTQSWSSTQRINLDMSNSLFLDLEFSESESKLYLFFDDNEERVINYATKSVSPPQIPNVSAENAAFQLHDAFPNPGNRTVTVPFTLTDDATVRIDVYGLDGSLIQRANAGTLQPGYHQQRFDVSTYSSGVYVYKVYDESSNYLTGKFTVIRTGSS